MHVRTNVRVWSIGEVSSKLWKDFVKLSASCRDRIWVQGKLSVCATLTTAKIHHTFMDNFPGLYILEMKTRRFCSPQRFRHWISLPAINTLYPISISINPGECAGPCLLAIILAWAIWQLHYELAVFGSDRIIDEHDVTGVGFVTPVGSRYALMKKTGHYLVTSTSWVTFNFI